jgi:protein gp37
MKARIMADTTNISWTDATWNIITGCTLVDEGCRNCYAAHLAANWPALARHPSRAGLARNNADGVAKFTGEVRFNEQWLDQPLRWKKPRRIFVCAHGDLFHESVPDEWIDRVFVVMALAPHHSFQVLTKRTERMRWYLSRADDQWHGSPESFADRFLAAMDKNYAWINEIDDIQWPLPNVWVGTSINDQDSADLRIPHLLATPAAIRFVSAEPLLGPVVLPGLTPYASPGHCISIDGDWWHAPGSCPNCRPSLDWVITGGESGKNARPAHPDWFRSLRDQCVAAGVAFHFKQWGAWADLFDHEGRRDWMLMHHDGSLDVPDYRWPDEQNGECAIVRVGTKRAGHLLDGVAWQQFPGGTHG